MQKHKEDDSLNPKKFTQATILNMKAMLQKRDNVELEQQQLNNAQVFLLCSRVSRNNCAFGVIFRKKNGNQNDSNYIMLMDNSEHSQQCLTQPTKQNSLEKLQIEQGKSLSQGSTILKQSQRQKQAQENSNEQLSASRIENNLKYPLENESPEKSKKGNQQTITPLEMELEELNGNQQYFSEEQILAMKKTLVQKYNALVSRSTCIDPITNQMTKISFKCKNSLNYNCPFFQKLSLVPGTNPPKFKLTQVNITHKQQCIMDCQELRYHQMTRKIDDNMELIDAIVKDLMSQSDNNVRPKVVLQMLAQRLGEENADFIYNGLQQRNHRRAIKKYFDNAVGKIRVKKRGII